MSRSVQFEIKSDFHIETVDTASYTPLSARHNPSFCHDLLSSTVHTHPSFLNETHPDAEVDMLCVNCYEFLSVDEVDAHSSLCIVPADELHIDTRLHKLRTAILKKRRSGDKAWALAQLEEVTLDALQPAADLQRLGRHVEELAGVSTLMSDGYAYQVLARRLLSLIEEKAEDNEFIKWQARVGVLLELAGCVGDVEDWPEDCGVLKNLKCGRPTEESTAQEKRRWFYSVCIQKKAKLLSASVTFDVPISEVYEQVLECQLPISAWEEYIAQIYE